MSDPSEEKGAERDMDHGLGGVEALLVVAHEAPPAHHPGEGSIDDPSTGLDIEAGGPSIWRTTSMMKSRKAAFFISCSMIGAVGKEVLEPGPMLADGLENRLCASRVRL